VRAHNDLAIRECNREAMHSRLLLDVEEDRNVRERERDKISSSSGVGVDGMGRGRRKLLLSETLINKITF
jgi:hypothetical protein